MHGGMKIYAGPPPAAGQYLEADRGRADDHYLAEGAGIARRYTATAGQGQEQPPLTGEGYEAWVAGGGPATGAPRGRLRTDERAVRFVEVVVNGPKSWSLAAAVHPDLAAATTPPRTAPPRKSSAGSPATPPPGSARAAGRSRCRSRCWRR